MDLESDPDPEMDPDHGSGSALKLSGSETLKTLDYLTNCYPLLNLEKKTTTHQKGASIYVL